MSGIQRWTVQDTCLQVPHKYLAVYQVHKQKLQWTLRGTMGDTHREYCGSPKSHVDNSSSMRQGCRSRVWRSWSWMWPSRIKGILEGGRLGSWLFTVLSWVISLTSLSFSFITCTMGILLLLSFLPPPFPPHYPPLPFSLPPHPPSPPPHPFLFLLLFKEGLPCRGRRRRWGQHGVVGEHSPWSSCHSFISGWGGDGKGPWCCL